MQEQQVCVYIKTFTLYISFYIIGLDWIVLEQRLKKLEDDKAALAKQRDQLKAEELKRKHLLSSAVGKILNEDPAKSAVAAAFVSFFFSSFRFCC